MKRFIWLMLCGLVFSANQCESELDSIPENEIEIEDQEKEDSISYVIAKLPEFENMSRAGNGISSNSPVSVSWNKDDQINLWWDDKKVFTISDDFSETSNGNKNMAKFTIKPAIKPTSYYAFYPPTIELDNDNIKFDNTLTKLDFTNVKTPEEKFKFWKEYLKKNMIFMAQGSLRGGQENVIKFQHLSSIYNITYKNITGNDITIDGIRTMFRSGNITLNKWDPYKDSSHAPYINTIETKGLTIADGESMDFYFCGLPQQIILGHLLIEYHDEYPLEDPMKLKHYIEFFSDIQSEIFKMDENGRTIRGGYYHLDAIETPSGLYWNLPNLGKSVTIENTEFSTALTTRIPSDLIKLNGNGYAVMDELDAKLIQHLIIYDYHEPITSVEGIENFTGLLRLNLDNVQLKSCDISKNTALRWISINANDFTELDLSNLQSLEDVCCIHNRLSYLDISSLPNLKKLQCGNQKDNMELKLKMTPEQKIKWDKDWSKNEWNKNVTVIVE